MDPELRRRIEEIDLEAQFEAEGRPYAVLNDDGEVEVRGVERDED